METSLSDHFAKHPERLDRFVLSSAKGLSITKADGTMICEHEISLSIALTQQFGDSAAKHYPSLTRHSVALGATPVEHVKRGGNIESAIGAIAPVARAC